MSYGLLLIIFAGLINASFVVPIKYVKKLSHEKIWLYHSLIGLVILPWALLSIASSSTVDNYLLLQPLMWLFLIVSGLIFGIGQLCFAYAIERIGMALSFTINLSLGITIGSLFVIFYRSAFLSSQGLMVTAAVFLILFGLAINYYANRVEQNNRVYQNTPHYRTGWLLATTAGLASGLQNIAFVSIAFHYQSQLQTTDSYWVWPPFLTAAAIPMGIGFIYRMNKQRDLETKFGSHLPFLRNLLLIITMGLCFTGSLALYSGGMNHLNLQQQMIGWPSLMVAIILTSQLWGWIYGEIKTSSRQKVMYQLSSIALLVLAIIILAKIPSIPL
jgi:L-rhamnose-H+ transport protein